MRSIKKQAARPFYKNKKIAFIITNEFHTIEELLGQENERRTKAQNYRLRQTQRNVGKIIPFESLDSSLQRMELFARRRLDQRPLDHRSYGYRCGKRT